MHILGAGLSGLAAATYLANAGREVHVHEIRSDSGARFDGDFQGIENWTSNETDFFDEIREWGFDPDEFKSDGFDIIDLIVAAGPRESSAVAFGEIFHTDHPNHVSFQLNDKLAPGAYSYLIIIDGIGLICTCLWRKQKRTSRYLNETIAWYEQHYDLNRRPIKRVGGKGDFSLPDKYVYEGRYYVGEAGGLQDFMWGFGMRYAITSGVLAAKAVLGECDYETEVRKRLVPLVRARRDCFTVGLDSQGRGFGLIRRERRLKGVIWFRLVDMAALSGLEHDILA